ncbi:MAG TPA: acyltransferase, partial [Nocardioidaceae bacterium]|nr:acyltransferase [Nocardioidaceae bacterium]
MLPESDRAWRLRSRPALDGLRGIACLLVLVGHQVPWLIPAGGVGVAVFFTLSGFLITALLLDRRTRSGSFQLADFYRRRALRLLPAFVVMLFIVGTISLAMAPDLAPPKALAASIFYYSNWMQAFGPKLGGLQHTWSLAIEEQFYLLWPLVLILAARYGRRGLLVLVACGSLASIVWRVVLYDLGEPLGRLYYGSDTRVDGLLVGCWLAIFLTGRAEGRARSILASGVFIATGAACVALVSSGVFGRFVVMPTVIAVGTAAVVWCVAQGRYSGWLGHPFLVLVGRRSYALYLWSLPLASMLDPFDLSYWIALPIGLALAAVAAGLSWKYVEEPFLRLKERTPRGTAGAE